MTHIYSSSYAQKLKCLFQANLVKGRACWQLNMIWARLWSARFLYLTPGHLSKINPVYSNSWFNFLAAVEFSYL